MSPPHLPFFVALSFIYCFCSYVSVSVKLIYFCRKHYLFHYATFFYLTFKQYIIFSICLPVISFIYIYFALMHVYTLCRFYFICLIIILFWNFFFEFSQRFSFLMDTFCNVVSFSILLSLFRSIFVFSICLFLTGI